MSIKQDMAHAKKLIQAKKYDEAITLLATIDHPTADRWRGRVESIIAASDRQKVKKEAKAKANNKAIGCLGVILICSIIWFVSLLAGNSDNNDRSYVEEAALIRGAIVLVTDIDLVFVDIVDNSVDGKTVIVAYSSSARTEIELAGEWGFLFGSVGSIVDEFNIYADTMFIVVSDENENMVGTVTVAMQDVLDFVKHTIDVETFWARLRITILD